MKGRTILLSVAVLLLAFTTIASASPEPPKKFRIEGDTTYIEFHIYDSVPPYIILMSEGRSHRNLHGTFSMSEVAIPTSFDPVTFYNEGTLEIDTKKGDHIVIEFTGTGDIETVTGTFAVLPASTAYDGMTGTFTGLADQCVFPCDPFSDPNCTQVDEPVCSGFYVDFFFD